MKVGSWPNLSVLSSKMTYSIFYISYYNVQNPVCNHKENRKMAPMGPCLPPFWGQEFGLGSLKFHT